MSLRRIFEGQDDRIFRNEAKKDFYALMNELINRPELFKVDHRNVMLKRGKSDSFPYLSVRFNFSPANWADDVNASFAPLVGGGGALIVVNVSCDVNAPYFDPLKWLIDNQRLWRMAFMHELVHYYDWQRIGHDDWRKLPKTKDGNKYYQDPIEQNAYFQSIAAEIAREYKNRIHLIKNMGVNEFYRMFVQMMDDEAMINPDKMYRKRQIPHLKKRVAQLYQDIIASG